MKKFAIILLMLVYGVSSSGMSVTLHYCMSRFSGWELSADASSNSCRLCGMKKQDRKGCCHDEKKTIRSEKDQKNAEVVTFSLKTPVTLTSTTDPVNFHDDLSNAVAELPFTHAPPYKKVPGYIYHCNFRI